MVIKTDNEKKTNITILNSSLWNWLKERKNPEYSKTISDTMFYIFDVYRKHEIEEKLLLESLEKHFEYSSFTMKDISFALKIPIEELIKKISFLLGDVPLFGSGSKAEKKAAKRKIHMKMVEKNIFPRELQAIIKLKEKFLHDRKLDAYEMVKTFYASEHERMMEIYNYTIQNVDELLDASPEFKEFIKHLENIDETEYKWFNNPDAIYFKLGLTTTTQEISDDLIMDIVKEHSSKNFLYIYGVLLEICIKSLAKRNLMDIKEFLEDDLYGLGKSMKKSITILESTIEKERTILSDFINIPDLVL